MGKKVVSDNSVVNDHSVSDEVVEKVVGGVGLDQLEVGTRLVHPGDTGIVYEVVQVGEMPYVQKRKMYIRRLFPKTLYLVNDGATVCPYKVSEYNVFTVPSELYSQQYRVKCVDDMPEGVAEYLHTW